MNDVLGQVVYLLCAATSVACAVMLIRAYRRTGTALLLWSSLCFVLLAINNVVLVFDFLVFPHHDLSMYRSLAALGGLGLLVFGLIWETR